MMWMTHIVIGLLLYAILVQFGVFPDNLLMIALVSFGSVLPDIDHPKAFVSHLSIWFKASSRVVSLGGHRGITHTIWAALVTFPLAYLVLKWLGIGGFVCAGAFLLGYLSHLLADSLTVSGVAWFYPFGKYRIRGPVRTGSIFEVLIFVLTSVLVLDMLKVRVSDVREVLSSIF